MGADARTVAMGGAGALLLDATLRPAWTANAVARVFQPLDPPRHLLATDPLEQPGDTEVLEGGPLTISADVPPLKKNPVFLYTQDRFQRPNPFRPDFAVSIDEVIEPTLDALLVMESQIHEGGANGETGLFPADQAGRQKRR
jgi:hypothetical protein